MSDESDALVIAKWCWPDDSWVEACGQVECCSSPGGFDHHMHDDSEGYYAVADAERILIERGHAEKYGKALWGEVWEQRFGLGNGVSIARIATAPLDARVRALASVIRALTAQSEPKQR